MNPLPSLSVGHINQMDQPSWQVCHLHLGHGKDTGGVELYRERVSGRDRDVRAVEDAIPDQRVDVTICRSNLVDHRYSKRSDRTTGGRPNKIRSIKRGSATRPRPGNATERKAAIGVAVRGGKLVSEISIYRLRRNIRDISIGV